MPLRRRRNSNIPEAILAAEAFPLHSRRELKDLSDQALFAYYTDALRHAQGAERHARKGSADGDRAYAAQRRVMDYVNGTLHDVYLERIDARQAVEQARQAAAMAARKAATATKRAATIAKKKAEANFIGSNYIPASTKVRLGNRIYVDEGAAFIVKSIAVGDSDNEQYAASLVASGVSDKRNHRGDWAMLERGNDALLVSIGRGPKRNPRAIRRRR